MTNVQTPAEIAEKIKREAFSAIPDLAPASFFDEEKVKAILEEWSAQLQPHPDESDEDVAREIFKLWHGVYPHGDDSKACLQATPIIARYTAAKVSASKANMFRSYDEYCFDGMGRIQLLNWIREKVYGLEPTYAQRDETLAEERGWNRGAKAARREDIRLCDCVSGLPVSDNLKKSGPEMAGILSGASLPPYQGNGEKMGSLVKTYTGQKIHEAICDIERMHANEELSAIQSLLIQARDRFESYIGSIPELPGCGWNGNTKEDD